MSRGVLPGTVEENFCADRRRDPLYSVSEVGHAGADAGRHGVLVRGADAVGCDAVLPCDGGTALDQTANVA